MDRSNVITLVAKTRTQDSMLIWHETVTGRDVFAQVDSVTRSEFFEAGRAGLDPAYRFTVFYADYEGEDTVIYNGKPYGIYRTYHARTDELELYAERKGGADGTVIEDDQDDEED